MKKFMEWVADKKYDFHPKLDQDSSYDEILDELNRALSFLKSHPEEDRVEFTVYGIDVRMWRTKINTITKTHVGYKAPWESRYYETDVEKMADFLYNRRGA